MTKRAKLAVVSAVIACAAVSPVQAQFFQSKIITMVINYGAGGNVDTEGRIFERHLGKHLAGKPTIIVNNVPGAGGLTAINQMGMGVGVKDPSLTLGFVTFNPVAMLIDDPALRVNVERFEMIAGVGANYVAYARKDALPGKGQPADIAKAKGIHAAGYARSSNHDIRLRLMFDLLGSEYKVVTGFQSIGAVNVAIEQNEINFMLSTLPGYETQAVPNLINKGIAIPLWQMGAIDARGNLVGNDKIEKSGVKFFEQVFEEAHGKKPSGPKYRALQVTNELSAKLARISMMPPGADKQAVQELRKAFAALEKDQEFVKEYTKIIQMEPELIGGEQAQRLLSEAVKATDAEVKAVLKDAAGVK